MREEDFIITISIGNRSRKQIWNAARPQRLDETMPWTIEKTKDGFFIHGHSGPKIPVTHDAFATGEPIVLPAVNTKLGTRQLDVRVRPLRTIAPVYVTPCRSEFDSAKVRPNQLFVFRGIGDYIVAYDPGGESYRAYVEQRPVFAYLRDEQGCRISALQEGVSFRCPNAEPIPMQVRKPIPIDDTQLTEGRIVWGKHWWRVARIPMPESLPLKILFEEDLKESLWFRRISRVVSSAFLVLSFLAILYPKLLLHPEKPKPPTQVVLKAPKEMPKVFEMPKPPEPPKPEPKPVVKAEPPAPAPKAKPPEKKVAQEPPAPVKQKPAPTAAPAPAPVPTAQQNQAELAKSLNFLAPSANKPKALGTNPNVANNHFQSAATGLVDPKRGSTILKDMAQNTGSAGPIDTKAARNINGAVAVGGKGKALNQVQGRVALNSLYNTSGGGELGSALTGAGSGMAMSGEGKLPESLIQKALAKYLDKFQYCYEKSLLSDSSLAGNVVMQWTISTDGSPSEIKVVRSQMNNAALHDCLSRQLAHIKFPAPTGGNVTVKYPFAFSSTSL